MEDTFLITLKEKEREVFKELKTTPIYKQWEGIKTTIALFEGKSNVNITENDFIEETVIINFDPNSTWAEKIFYALSKIGAGFVSDIVKELKKVDNTNEEILGKRIGNMISQLLRKKELQIIQKSGKRIKVAKK